MKIRVLWFGRTAAKAFDPQVEDYRKRVHHRWPAEDHRLRPASGGRDSDPRRALRQEAEAVRKHVPGAWRLVVLEEGGTGLSSEGFAEMLGEAEDNGVPGIVLVIGSDLGLDQELLDAAALRLSLGPMTLAHQLARVVLWEQLFRATHILGGGPYHRLRVQ
jgi:23S rRNA (pseudouridine1915-N3)-methyltransferase